MDFDLMPWAHLRAIHDHFRHFHWLHPWMHGRLSKRVLDRALHEGHLMECKRRPWMTASPALLFALRGRAPSARAWQKMREGPQAHEALILRTAREVLAWPGVRISVDESLDEASPPPGWGGYTKLVPDIEISFEDPLLPRLWIECERTLRTAQHYARRLPRIRRHLIFYVVHGERQRGALAERLGLQGLTATPRRSPGRVRVLTESQWRSFARRHHRKLVRAAEHPHF